MVVAPNSKAVSRKNCKSLPVAPVIADRFDIDLLKSVAAFVESKKNFATSAPVAATATPAAAVTATLLMLSDLAQDL